ncbi:MAG TPA: hypothetical protein VHV31_07145 [Nitrolancea sp.]|jgi:hypothetical protein|nr:hypothetical protein [Nitrolancea sp.]
MQRLALLWLVGANVLPLDLAGIIDPHLKSLVDDVCLSPKLAAPKQQGRIDLDAFGQTRREKIVIPLGHLPVAAL